MQPCINIYDFGIDIIKQHITNGDSVWSYYTTGIHCSIEVYIKVFTLFLHMDEISLFKVEKKSTKFYLDIIIIET